MNLTKQDITFFKNYGLTLEKVYRQLEAFSLGIPFVEVATTASIGNGIEAISVENQQKLIDFYDSKKNNLEIVKFVPASGAATRMFQFLFEFLENYNPEELGLNKYLKTGNHQQLSKFVNSIKDFAFLNAVRKKIRENYPDFKHGTKGVRTHLLVKTMLEEKGLNFGSLPKGLIPFHKYTKYATTAFEEHLYEAAFYASVNNNAYLHFTFSKKHVTYFKKEFEAVKKRVSKKTKTEFHISYSFQKKETDTIAVNIDNSLFKNSKNECLLRPSGHGALLGNLNNIDADIIFIKNIDNVVTEEFVEQITHYKKVLAGKLLWVQEKVFSYLKLLTDHDLSIEKINEIKLFLWNELNIKNAPDNKTLLIDILNRPLRICGVVKNTGAPGGGPFWVKNEKGETTLQIVELSQINPNNEHHQSIVNEATHFNPVDLVCGIRDFRGNKFDLTKFTDPNSGIISEKSKNGKTLKALELPGLWNGAMANWNTIFVEVPLITFNPVKTVNDLLSKEHRSNA
ncbi:MAG: DUF4301 family protein [Flavobacteriaceae bacterium]|nr:DUF4301 family protein [Flavobacteriaceae bacterium]